jgi:imidazolonepropionase-like amidohydrolase
MVAAPRFASSLVIAMLAIAGCRSAPQADRQAGTEADLVIEDAVLIDGTGAPPRPGTTLVIDDGVIVAIAARGERVPPARVRIDGSGRYVMPGLVDVHVHLGSGGLEPRTPDTAKRALRQFLYYGVTSVLVVGGSGGGDEEIAELRAAQRRGDIRGARVFATGSLLTAPGSHPASTILADIPGSQAPGFDWSRFGVTLVDSPEAARAAVARKVALGLDAVKVIVESGPSPFGTDHPMLEGDVLATIVAAARANNLPVLAHTTDADEMRTAVRAGVNALMHAAGERPYPDAALAAEMAKRGVVQVATLSLYDGFYRFLDDPSSYDEPFLREGVAASTLASLRDAKGFQAAHAPTADLMRREHAERMAAIATLHAGGVTFALGTDTNNPWSFPGYGAHRELELLVAAGLTPMEAIVAATRNGARLVHQEATLGTLAVGKRADLLLLSADPLTDIRATHTLTAVIQDGRVVDRNALLQ